MIFFTGRQFFLAVILTYGMALHASSLSEVGKLVLAKGKIIAKNVDGVRDLKKNSDIFESDKLVVDKDSMAGLRMKDGSLITLIADTEYQIESFFYDPESNNGNFVSELIKGGFRLSSGAIGKTNPEKYEIKTVNATIGLRGTIVECLFKEETLYVHVNEGQAALTNGAGTIVIGTGTVQYAVVSRYSELAQTLLSRPAELTPHFVPMAHPRS